MMIKKYIVLLILIFAIKLAFGQSGPALITLTPSSQTVNSSDPVSIEVGVQGVVGLYAISVTLSFNNSIIKCLSITQGDFLSTNAGGYGVSFETFPEDLYAANTVTVDQSILGLASVSGTGEIFNITFEPFASGTSHVEVTSFSLRDINNQEIPATAESAVINVNSLNAAVITLTPSSQTVNTSDPVSIEVGVQGAVGLYAISVTLSFNNSIIKCQSISQGDFLSNNTGGYDVLFETFPEDLYTANTVTVDQSILGLASVTGTGEIFTITFEPFAGGTSQVVVTSFSLRDINNQEIHATAESAEINVNASVVNAKIFLQGSYNSGVMQTTLNSSGLLPLTQPYSGTPWNYNGNESVSADFFVDHTDIVDWVLIELRSDLTTVAATHAALLRSDGSIVDINGLGPVRFFGIPAAGYYIVVKHRNHLAIMSSNAVLLSGSSSMYDFTTGQNKAYGTDAMKDLGGGFYGLYTGDGNRDGLVTSTDFNVFNPKFTSAASGYEYSDWNLDGMVTSTDFNFFNPNFTSAKQTFVP